MPAPSNWVSGWHFAMGLGWLAFLDERPAAEQSAADGRAVTAPAPVQRRRGGGRVSWSARARAARLGGGVGGRAREGLAVAGQ
jgi:hypothetical protein